MTIRKSDLPIDEITKNIGNLFSKVKSNASRSKRSLSSGITLGKVAESISSNVLKKQSSISQIEIMSSYNMNNFISLVESLRGKEKGGPISSGQPYLVGEKGPEMIIPNSSGQVITNNNLKAISPDRDIGQLNRSTTRKKIVVQPIITTNTITKIRN